MSLISRLHLFQLLIFASRKSHDLAEASNPSLCLAEWRNSDHYDFFFSHPCLVSVWKKGELRSLVWLCSTRVNWFKMMAQRRRRIYLCFWLSVRHNFSHYFDIHETSVCSNQNPRLSLHMHLNFCFFHYRHEKRFLRAAEEQDGECAKVNSGFSFLNYDCKAFFLSLSLTFHVNYILVPA